MYGRPGTRIGTNGVSPHAMISSTRTLRRSSITTLLFARRVGELMAELGEDDLPNPSYRFYV